jgi:acyl-CoA thioesterase FadM
MTVRLELDYRRPVPLATALVLRAEVAEPRPEQTQAYFGSVTDSSGRHAPPGNPTDASAVHPD